MGDWTSDDEVRSAADRAARGLIDLFDDEQPDGKWLGSPEAYPDGGGAVLLRGLLDDADQVLSLDPQKIIDEFERMKKVGRVLDQDTSSDIVDAFRKIDYSVQDWEGGGADAFRHQISMIQAFLGQQTGYLIKTVESLAVLLAASVQARRDYVAVADATGAAVAKALEGAEHGRQPGGDLVMGGRGVSGRGAGLGPAGAVAGHDLVDDDRNRHGLNADVTGKQVVRPAGRVLRRTNERGSCFLRAADQGMRGVPELIEGKHQEPAFARRVVTVMSTI
ncbi:hypothetical protein [Amycolatopsis sp. NPDC051061]|uniref:hypothetical protein n=1 Tax=Amycolatopsis sp. NPDC051061 TaxID=3155042 RepID=UPI0034151923